MLAAPTQSADYVGAEDAAGIVAMSRRTMMRRLEKDPEFPKPERDSPLRWRRSALEAWSKRKQEVDGGRLRRRRVFRKDVARVAAWTVVLAFAVTVCMFGGYCMLMDVYGQAGGHLH